MQVDGDSLPKEGLDKEAADKAVKDLAQLSLQAIASAACCPCSPFLSVVAMRIHAYSSPCMIAMQAVCMACVLLRRRTVSSTCNVTAL